ncbi:MAG: alpha/beta hydrolase [Lentilactobacillus diolivorans]|nr:alpha/beta hydrolase [Lentilactobacillus diolivorans]
MISVVVLGVILICLLFVVIVKTILLGRPRSSKTQTVRSTPLDQVPTLFLPGYLGNRFSFGFLQNRLVSKFNANKSMVIIVNRHGKLRVIGQMNDYRTMIQVLFKDKTSRPKQQAIWLLKICQLLEAEYHVSSVNLVGHSMGCITIFWYLTHEQAKSSISVKRVVAIAGPFNDSEIARSTPDVDAYPFNANGPVKRMPIYRALSQKIAAIPPEISVLNIAGKINDEQQNDGQVSLNSAFSLRYLLQQPAHYYREVVIRGKWATHRLLHENRLVDANIAKFIWDV